MDNLEDKYKKLLEQFNNLQVEFNDLQVAYHANCAELEMLRAAANDNVRIYCFDCLFSVFYSFACCR